MENKSDVLFAVLSIAAIAFTIMGMVSPVVFATNDQNDQNNIRCTGDPKDPTDSGDPHEGPNKSGNPHFCPPNK